MFFGVFYVKDVVVDVIFFNEFVIVLWEFFLYKGVVFYVSNSFFVKWKSRVGGVYIIVFNFKFLIKL